MKLFLDSSAVIAACGRATGASRFLFEIAQTQGWILQSSNYAREEVDRNIVKLPGEAIAQWRHYQTRMDFLSDVLTFPWLTVFAATKDRPILFTAATHSHVLLTLDRRDFSHALGSDFYGLAILTPGAFLKLEGLI